MLLETKVFQPAKSVQTMLTRGLPTPPVLMGPLQKL